MYHFRIISSIDIDYISEEINEYSRDFNVKSVKIQITKLKKPLVEVDYGVLYTVIIKFKDK